MKIVYDKSVDAAGRKKAALVIARYLNKQVHARKFEHGRFEALDISYRIRATIKKDMIEVMSHEKYNKLKTRLD